MKLVIKTADGQPVTTSEVIAANTDTQHKNVLELIREYEPQLSELGRVAFETRTFKTAGGPQKREIAELNEQQATFVLTLMRNSDAVVKFKLSLVKAFYEMRTKVGAGETAKALANPTGATRAHLMVVSAMEKMGVRKEMAMAVALQAIHDDTGLTTEGYRLALPGVEDVCNLNQKQLGELIGVSSREIGRQLRAAALLDDDEAGQRIVTEKGRQFGEMKPYKAFNGHAGYEARWRKEVLDFLTQGEAA